MSALVSSFIPLQTNAHRRLLFLLVTWTDFLNHITGALQENRDAFGQALGLHAEVVQAYKGATQQTFNEVKRKAWPPEVDNRLEREQHPFMIVIENDFEIFEPSLHRWGVLWFSDLEYEPELLWKVFAAIARKVQRDEDIFEYLASLSRNAKYSEFVKNFEVKPGAFGITANLKAIAMDLLGVGLKNAT